MMISSPITMTKTSVGFSLGEKERPDHEHCPLCVGSMVYPENDNREPAIIFLDMDGVMIGDRFVDPLNSKIRSTMAKLFPDVDNYRDYHWTIAKGRHLNTSALIERIESSGRRALVVLSTAWRNDATLKQHREEAFIEHDFSKYICGKSAPKNSDTSWTPECKQGFIFKDGA